MALTSVEVALMGIFDRWGYQKSAAAVICAGGTDVWTRVDDAADETFENRVKGTHCTDLDTTFTQMDFGQWTNMGTVLADIVAYITHDAGYAGINAYLTAKRWRLDAKTANVFRERYGEGVLSLPNVCACGDMSTICPGFNFGDLTQSGALSGGADLDLALYSPAPPSCRVVVKGANVWNLTVVVNLWDASTKSITQAIGASDPVDTRYILGAQAINAPVAAGQKVVTMGATGQFKAGQKVLVTEWTGAAPNEVWVAQEIGTVGSVQTNVSLTMVDNLLHDYTAAGFVYPTVKGVVSASGTGGTAGDKVRFAAGPDRRLKL